MASNGVIGNAGTMPWKLSSDLKRFKRDTLGKPIIMGRKTFDSIGKPLPGRLNIVISRSELTGDQIVHAGNLKSAIFIAQGWALEHEAREICIIGGGQIYAEAMPLASKLYVTEVQASPEGDTYFPAIDNKQWKVSHEEAVPQGQNDTSATIYKVYQRIN